MEDSKIKATDFVVEALKLIVTLSTIFFGGLLAYRANISSPSLIWSYYAALGLMALSAILSIANINSLINKVYRNEENAIQQTEAKVLNVLATLTLLSGMGFGAVFLSSQSIPGKPPQINDQTTITDSQVVVSGEVKSNIQVTRGSNGKITNITIAPK